MRSALARWKIRSDEEEATVHAWLNELEWVWLGFFIVSWIFLIAALGYAAAHISLRQPHKKA